MQKIPLRLTNVACFIIIIFLKCKVQCANYGIQAQQWNQMICFDWQFINGVQSTKWNMSTIAHTISLSLNILFIKYN